MFNRPKLSGWYRNGVGAPAYNISFLGNTVDSSLTFSRLSNATRYDSTGKIIFSPANMLLNSATLSTQSVTVMVGQTFTLSFYGTGSVSISGGVTDSLSGTGASNRVSKNLAATTTTTMTFTVSGSVTSAQLELTSYNSPLSYNPTTSTAYYGPRFDYDPSTLALRGLLIEEQRTNMMLYSVPAAGVYTYNNSSALYNQIAAPDNTTSGVTLLDNFAVGGHYMSQTAAVAYVSGTTYTVSVYAKAKDQSVVQLLFPLGVFGANAFANFDLSNGTVGTVGSSAIAQIQNAGNGWYRCSITANAIAGGSSAAGFVVLTNSDSSAIRNPTYTGTGTGIYLWGIQTEAATFPSSYIPTTGSAATRAADSLVNTSIGGWYNATQGGMQAEYISEGVSLFPVVASFNDNTANNCIRLGLANATTIEGIIKNGGSTAAQKQLTNGSVLVPHKMALTYSAASFQAAQDGTISTSQVPSALPTVTRLSLGRNEDGSVSLYFSGWLRNFKCWNKALTNAQLQQITN